MKKKVMAILLVLMLICSACSQPAGPETAETVKPTEAPVPETQPVTHSCSSVCAVCRSCTNAGCTEPACQEKCACTGQETPYAFPEGDYITAAAETVDTGTVVFDLGQNVYVPGNLAQMIEPMVAAMEKVSGLDFDGAGYARSEYPDGKVHVLASRNNLYAGNPEYSWYQGLQTSEYGMAYASASSHAEISPGDLVLGNSNAMIHELGHVLMFRQSEWNYCQLLSEGFADYTNYLTLLELEQNNPVVCYYFDRAVDVLCDMQIFNYAELFKEPVEHWFENTFEFAGNGNYAVGFRFMAYLRDVYGDYSKWIPAAEQAYCYRQKKGSSDQMPVMRQIEVLKTAYGEDVLEGFYPWLQDHLDQFDGESQKMTTRANWSALEGVNWYPVYNAISSMARMESFHYEDLYLNVETVRRYISQYKGEDAASLSLVTSRPVQVRLYKADGTYTTVLTKAWNDGYNYDWPSYNDSHQVMENYGLALDDISYIRLLGDGDMEYMEIVGDFRKDKT